MTRAPQPLKQLPGVKRYAPILIVVWMLCVAPMFAAEAIPGPSDDHLVIGVAADFPPYSFYDENGLAVLEKTGVHKEIHDKWLGTLVPRGVSLSTVLKYIALVVAPLLLLLAFFAIWCRALKRQVTRRTQELSDSEERYRAVAEDTPVLFCSFLPGGEITYVNEAYCKYFEKTAEDLVGKTFLSLIPEADRETVMAEISTMTVASPNQSHEHHVIGPEGEIRWTRWTNRAQFDAQGKVLTYQSIGEDITARKQADEALQAASQLNKDIIDSSPIGISIFNSKGDCIASNDAAAEAVGATKAQLLKQNYHQLDSWKKSGLYDVALCSIQENAKKHHKINITTTFGKVCTLDIHLVPISIGNEPHLFTMFDDITERKLSEEKIARLGRIFEDSLNEIYLFDTETLQFTQVNRAAQKNLGYTMEELQKMTPVDLKPDITPELFSGLLTPLRNGEKSKIVFETRHKRKDQSLYNVEIHLQLLKNEHKALFAAIILDITERKQAEARIKQQQYYFEKAQELGQIGTWELDLRLNKLYWTEENCRIFGVPVGSVVNYEIFLGKVHPDDREYVDQEWAAALDGKPYDIEHRIVIDGAIKWVREKADVEFDEQGAPVKAFGFTRDITERKQAAKELQKHQDHLEEMIQERTDELKRTINLMAGREVRMAELKELVKRLQDQLEEAGLHPIDH